MRKLTSVSLLALIAATTATSASAIENLCGTEPVVLNAYFETGFPLAEELATEFTRQHPNVTFDIKEDLFRNLMENSPRVLAGDNAPDLIRLPSISDLVANDLLLELDPYMERLGWDEYPPAQLAQNRVGEGGRPRGEGSLYAMGLNYSMTGVFYNKELAAQIGMTEAPSTLAEFEELLAMAKEAGIQPIVQWNTPNAGLAFPLQNLMGSLGDPEPINAWIFQLEGASIDTAPNLEAAEHLEMWVEAGYFPTDTNAIDYATAMGRFIDGQALFIFNGDWESGNLDAQMTGNAGFFLMPPAEEGGRHAAMSAPLTYGIGARAQNPECAAYFLAWVSQDEEARKINVEVGGSNPGGPGLPLPEVDPNSVTAQTLAAGNVVAEDNGAMDFIANATGAIFAEGWTPTLQELVGGRNDAAGVLEEVQEEYERELSR